MPVIGTKVFARNERTRLPLDADAEQRPQPDAKADCLAQIADRRATQAREFRLLIRGHCV